MAEPQRNNDSRREMLAAIREYLALSVPFDAAHEEHRARHEVTAPQVVASTEYSGSLLERFKQSLEAVGGHCIVAPSEAAATEIVQEIVGRLRARRIAISDSPLVGRVLKHLDPDVEILERAAKSDLFKCDVGITGAQWAIAETGTLALESDSERHRLASLVPPVHVAIIEAERLRATLGEVLQSISESGRNLSRTITFITGPSRTSDIELTLAIGVHGPAELYVIVLEGATAAA